MIGAKEMNDLSKILDNFGGSEIIFEKIDLYNHKIFLKIKITENNETKTFNIILINVSSFSWINNQGEERKNINFWEFLELESVSISSSAKINISGDEWDNNFYSKPNLIFEIWNSAFYVETNEVIINEVSYTII